MIVGVTSGTETPITITTTPPSELLLDEIEDATQRHLDGRADADEVALLEANRAAWVRALYRLYDDVAERIDDVYATVKPPLRHVIVDDLESEFRRIDDQLTALVGPPVQPIQRQTRDQPGAGQAQLQLSWTPGRIIAWAAGHNAKADDAELLLERLADADAGSVEWEEHKAVKLPDGSRADAVSATVESCLGWLVALGATAQDDSTGPSVAWLGHAAAFAVRLAGQGRIVPQVKKHRRPRADQAAADESTYSVHWSPALVDSASVDELAKGLPGSVRLLENRPDNSAFTLAVLSDLLDAIVYTAARMVDVPAPPPRARDKSEVAEAVLGNLHGDPFLAPTRLGSELARRLDQWAKPVTKLAELQLVVQLDPPDSSNAWHLKVLAPLDKDLVPVETALVAGSTNRRRQAKDQLARLERLIPELLRLGGRRQGEVILSQDEAWRLMSEDGPTLQAAGFEVRVPALSRRKPSPSLRITSEETDTVVGAQQLANVRWSVVFDDVELTAEEIRDLASQAKPLVKSRGKWVEVDRADLNQAAAALAEKADQTELTGADMLRHALGLEGSPLAGGISLAGEGWAADLFESARSIPADLPTQPDGFDGELRHYQADALGWLNFLDSAGLGGCLALDMGLGKTPTMLAHVRQITEHGPSLVVAPPAVVGNWASEARKFTPTLKVKVHHGPGRASGRELTKLADKFDLIITTYGTAVRDIDVLEKMALNTVVLDEAQAIKNPTSETAQQLRRLGARRRLALTGTPIENGLGDLWAIMDFCNPGLVGGRAPFVSQLSVNGKGKNNGKEAGGEQALRALNGILVFRRTKAEPEIAAELPDRIDELDHCAMTPEQIGLYQAVLDNLVATTAETDVATSERKGAVLAAITALKQICNHPLNYQADDNGVAGRSGKLARLDEIIETVFAAGERILIFTHFASWGETLAQYLTERNGTKIACYHGGLSRGARDALVKEFQTGEGAGAMVLSLKAGGTGLNLTAANHVVLYDRWWNPAVEDQARDRVWRIGQEHTVVCHRLVCPGTVDERVEEVVAGKRQIADMVLPKSSSVGDLDADQLQRALGIDTEVLMTVEDNEGADT